MNFKAKHKDGEGAHKLMYIAFNRHLHTHAYNKNKHEKGEEEEAKRFDFDKSSNGMMLLLSPLLTKINVFTI